MKTAADGEHNGGSLAVFVGQVLQRSAHEKSLLPVIFTRAREIAEGKIT